MKQKLITCTLLICLLVCLLGNCYQAIMYHRVLGTINNLKTSLNITNQRITDLENRQQTKPLIKVYSPIQTKKFPDYQMENPYIPNNNYFELQQHKDRLDNLQKQTDEINQKLKDAEREEMIKSITKPMFTF